MAGFGYKTGWLAIRDGDLQAVLTVLGGRAAGQVDWPVGIERAYDEPHTLVATPLLPSEDGALWLLIAGQWIAANHDSIDVAALSAALDREVQLFVTHRVVDLHRWERARDGVTIRSFEYLGETGAVQRWHGAPQDVELTIGLPATFDVVRDDVSDRQHVVPNEADVIRVAAAWSIDPTSLEGLPATARLSLLRLPVPARAVSVPDHLPVAVDVTDLITSDEPHEDKMKRLAGRLRKAGWTGADQ